MVSRCDLIILIVFKRVFPIESLCVCIDRHCHLCCLTRCSSLQIPLPARHTRTEIYAVFGETENTVVGCGGSDGCRGLAHSKTAPSSHSLRGNSNDKRKEEKDRDGKTHAERRNETKHVNTHTQVYEDAQNSHRQDHPGAKSHSFHHTGDKAGQVRVG